MTAISRAGAFLALGTALSTSPTLAQGQRGKFSTELSSVKEVHVETAPLGDRARSCGVTAADLESPAQAAIGASRLTVRQSATDFVFVNVNVATAGELCAAGINVELFRCSRDFNTSVSVWAHHAVVASGRSGFNTRVRDRVDTLTKEFIADWTKARQ